MNAMEIGRTYYRSMKKDLAWLLSIRDGQVCSIRFGWGCGKAFAFDDLTMDHIRPRSRGGAKMDINNLQLLCRECHERKSVMEGTQASVCKKADRKKSLVYPKTFSYFVPSVAKLCQQKV